MTLTGTTHRYTATFNKKESIMIRGFEAPVSMPDKPPRREMINFGMETRHQKWRRTTFPDWENASFFEKQKLVEEETHKRLNGQWWLINGREIYINGWCYFFLNYHWAEWGDLPDFRQEAWEFFLVWDHCWRDPNCFGMFDIKGRRVGDTEKTLCLMYDVATRFKNSWCGQQNINDEAAAANFDRLVKSHQKMQPWFKPVNAGGDAPKKELLFEFPSKSDADTLTDRSRSTFGVSRGIGSKIDYEASVVGKYDGKRLRMYYDDELGKTDQKRFDMEKQWGIIKPCLTLNNQRRIIGKAIFTTTVENLKGGLSLAICTKFWEQSCPLNKLDNGRTESGLYRYFRDYVLAAEPDEYGFYIEDEAKRNRDIEIRAYKEKGDLTGLADYKRRFPESVEDALSTPSVSCPLFPDLLDYQMDEIKRIENTGTAEEKQSLEVRGDLIWKNGFGSEVMWAPNPSSGRWHISRHPMRPNNVIKHNGRSYPGNDGIYAMGVDPIDHNKPQQGRFSYGAIAVFMPYNPVFEDSACYDENGEVAYPWLMKTDQYVCTYKARPDDPLTLYDDVVKTAWYYGTQAFIERDKPGVLGFMKNKGLDAFLAYKPSTVNVGVKNEKQPGAKTSIQLINVFVPKIQTHIFRRIRTYRHKELLAEYRNFTGENTKQSDLLIASGYALMMAEKIVVSQDRKQKGWGSIPYM